MEEKRVDFHEDGDGREVDEFFGDGHGDNEHDGDGGDTLAARCDGFDEALAADPHASPSLSIALRPRQTGYASKIVATLPWSRYNPRCPVSLVCL